MGIYQVEARSRYEEKIEAIQKPAHLKEWAVHMEARYGKEVKLYNDVYSDWILCLMIVRWGGDEKQWPSEFTSKDIHRAVTWFKGKTPHGITYKTEAGFEKTMSEMLLN